MKTQKYLINFRSRETRDVIYTFYINARDINNAIEIARDLTHDYNDTVYFDVVDVENA